MTIHTKLGWLLALGSALGVSSFAESAQAQSTIRDPNPPRYGLEIEPKLNLAYFAFRSYGGNGFGPGVRASIPLMSPGFVKTINDSVAITFGLDVLRYEGYSDYWWYTWCDRNRANCPGWYAGYDTGFWAAHFPVAMQWNFWLTQQWSVFGEPGVNFRYAFYQDPPWCATWDPRQGPCGAGDKLDLYFAFFAGARYKFSDTLALTMRVGHPILFSIGLSIFP